MEQKRNVYRATRRNAARAGGILNQWRFRPRIKTGLYGKRGRTYVVAAHMRGMKA